MSNSVYVIWEGNNSSKPTKKNARYIGITDNYARRLKEHQDEVAAHKQGNKTAKLNVERKIAASTAEFQMEELKSGLTAKEAAEEKRLIAEYQTFSGTYGEGWNDTEGG